MFAYVSLYSINVGYIVNEVQALKILYTEHTEPTIKRVWMTSPSTRCALYFSFFENIFNGSHCYNILKKKKKKIMICVTSLYGKQNLYFFLFLN